DPLLHSGVRDLLDETANLQVEASLGVSGGHISAPTPLTDESIGWFRDLVLTTNRLSGKVPRRRPPGQGPRERWAHPSIHPKGRDMTLIKSHRPSPWMLVAVAALAFAMVGTAV